MAGADGDIDGLVTGADDKVQGTHNCANRQLLTETLRDDWGFTGHVISDGGAVGAMADRAVSNNTAYATTDEAASAALRAGCDVAMGHAFLGNPLNKTLYGGNDRRDGIEAMVGNGSITIDLVKRAVRHRAPWRVWSLLFKSLSR